VQQVRASATGSCADGRKVRICRKCEGVWTNDRLKVRYQKEIAPTLQKEFGYTNVMAIPKITKIVINMGLGERPRTRRSPTSAPTSRAHHGQKAMVRRSTKSIGSSSCAPACRSAPMVTRAARRMYEFLDRLISIALPRVRDFRGGVGQGASTAAATTRSACATS